MSQPARKRALDLLYAAEMRGEDVVRFLDQAIEAGEGPSNPYVEVLVRGVAEHRARIDELLTEYSEGWALNRMPAVDRSVLRMGVFELVRDLSTDDSPGFVNGVLGAMLRGKDEILA